METLKDFFSTMSMPAERQEELNALFAAVETKTTQPLNQRLWDLVRHQRSELHEAELISDDEYAILAQDHSAVRRLEDYDASVKRIAQLEAELKKFKGENQQNA